MSIDHRCHVLKINKDMLHWKSKHYHRIKKIEVKKYFAKEHFKNDSRSSHRDSNCIEAC